MKSNIDPKANIIMGWYRSKDGSLIHIYDFHARRHCVMGSFVRKKTQAKYYNVRFSLKGEYLHKLVHYSQDSLDLVEYLGLEQDVALARYRGLISNDFIF